MCLEDGVFVRAGAAFVVEEEDAEESPQWASKAASLLVTWSSKSFRPSTAVAMVFAFDKIM